MIKKYYFGNWKMYQTFSSLKKFVKAYKADPIMQHGLIDRYIGIAASYEHLYFVQQKIKNLSVHIGAQDCSQFAQGAYTGQVSTQSLLDMNIDFCIVGHSETRIYLEQSDEQIALKFKMLLSANISPILCIGESLAQKEQGKTLQVLFDQLALILGVLESYRGDCRVFIAYEPIYAIGTGFIPTQQDLQEVFYFLKKIREQLSIAKNVVFLYGGSVSAETIDKLWQIDEISGFLIGKSSINFQDLKKIVES